LGKDADSRLANLRPLVVATVDDAALEAALRDIARGDGNEMLWTRFRGSLQPPRRPWILTIPWAAEAHS
jgi:hypothetical protein